VDKAPALGHEIPMSKDVPAEAFRPIPVRRRPGATGRLLFALRTVGDLQLLTCTRFLAPHLARVRGTVLDVGCGEMPFRDLLRPDVHYTGIDFTGADAFGMRAHDDIVAFDGRHIPFPDDSFDNVLCTEVLEHAEDPVGLVMEMQRVLRPGGILLATVPFAARVHYAPHDHHRFTRFRLARIFQEFEEIEISERGDDVTVIANKLIVVCARLASGRPAIALLWRVPLLVFLLPLTCIALVAAHLSLLFGWGSKMDPLGYGIKVRKAR
jgi:SAM-dependent methyltransferase